jgi:ribosomal protein L37E
MSDIVRDVHQEFWRPPVSQPETTTNLAEACRRCGTEFMVGSAFCHICGANRHSSTTTADSWVRHLGFVRAIEFGRVKSWLGLPVPSLCAFLLGIALLILAVAVSFVTVHDVSDFEAVQLWRIQWLMAACAAFLVGILLKNPKPEN